MPDIFYKDHDIVDQALSSYYEFLSQGGKDSKEVYGIHNPLYLTSSLCGDEDFVAKLAESYPKLWRFVSDDIKSRYYDLESFMSAYNGRNIKKCSHNYSQDNYTLAPTC